MMMQKIRGKNESGFTLIELMIVIAIIGILAAIAIPNFIAYRKRSYHSTANSDAKNAYTAAQAYFSDYPTATLTTTGLYEAGYQQSENVNITLSTATMNSLNITTHHPSGEYSYSVLPEGEIKEK